ncbi:MAG: serine/threonine protein kinase [Gorillibacterium sp.]|nr:serine/threonine protein kinase [Gorillibacterium sp.]
MGHYNHSHLQALKGGAVTIIETKREIESLQMGDWVGERYRILSRIGRGGMSVVYLAEDTRLPGKQWAIKASERYSCDPRGFEEEARMLAGLDHPFLPKVADFYPPNQQGTSYLVMDFVKGETLQHKFEQDRLSMRQLLAYTLQLCDLFDYLHGIRPQPVIYRDLKPGNIMIDEQDNVRLIDFGIARKHTPEAAGDTVCFGTVGFAAPEQFGNGPSDSRTDLYTLGAMMFYLLYGGAYYTGGSLPEREDCPLQLSQIIERLLQADPDERYQSAKELKAELEKFLYRARVEFGSHPEQPDGGQVSHPLALSKQLIVIGSMYPGAGSTFTSLALCHALEAVGVKHALVEFSANEPELYNLLYGEKRAPQNTLFLQDLLADKVEDRKPWIHSYTEWVPLDPDRERLEWAGKHGLRLLQSLKRPIIIVDISHDWNHPGARELIGQADCVFGVFGPHPAKLSGTICRKNAELLLDWCNKGKAIWGLANADSPFSGRKEWLHSLPLEIAGVIPAIPADVMASAQWQGKPMITVAEQCAGLNLAMEPIIAKFLPTALFYGRKTGISKALASLKRKVRYLKF